MTSCVNFAAGLPCGSQKGKFRGFVARGVFDNPPDDTSTTEAERPSFFFRTALPIHSAIGDRHVLLVQTKRTDILDEVSGGDDDDISCNAIL